MPDGNKRSYLHVYLNKLLLNAAGCLAKPLEISQNLQESTCARVNFTKKKTLALVFSSEFREISKNNFSQNTSWRLLL